VVSESRVTWAIPVSILVFLGLSVLDLGPRYMTDRRQTKASFNAPPIRGETLYRLYRAMSAQEINPVTYLLPVL